VFLNLKDMKGFLIFIAVVGIVSLVAPMVFGIIAGIIDSLTKNK
jgi:hypothetical protein